MEEWCDESRRVRQYPSFYQGSNTTLNPLSHCEGTYSHSGLIVYPRFPISELQISWKVNFKNEICTRTVNPQISMLWIKEVEKAKSVGDLMTSQSITRQRDFPDYDMLDAMVASALKKLLTHVHFRRRVSVEKQRAQKDERFLRRRQIACMIYNHFLATGACDAAQGLSDLFNIGLHEDDSQNFDARRDQPLLTPQESVLEGLWYIRAPRIGLLRIRC